MKILFWLNKNRKNAHGTMPVMLRITYQKRRININTGIYTEEGKWNRKRQQLRGNDETTSELNSKIKNLQLKAIRAFNSFVDKERPFTANDIAESIQGTQQKEWTVLEAFAYHNNQMKEAIGKGYSQATWDKYEATYRILQEFFASKMNVTDILLSQLTYKVITDFNHYLRVERSCNENSASKRMQQLKKITRIAIQNGWMHHDPFVGYKLKTTEAQRTFLTADELQAIVSVTLTSEKLQHVRDVFVFSCYTGLAYSDLAKLSPSNIVPGIDKRPWIALERTKTKTQSRIPLLPVAREILSKYSDSKKNKLLPIISNQRMNQYLKDIARAASISKNITCHMARHTFATVVTLNNGVDLATVSKMLGHKKITITQHYARLLDNKISDDMMMLESKLNTRP